MLSIFKPAAHKARLPAAEIDPLYRRLRWQIFIGIFFGYAAYYLVRKNFALAMPYLIEQGSPAAISVSPFPVSPSPTDFRNSSWARSLTARIRAFSCRRADPRRAGDAGDGLCAVGDLQHHDHVRAAVPLRLVPGDGLAAVRPYHGALVVAERARRHCLGVELRA
jgi:hypothetical protein